MCSLGEMARNEGESAVPLLSTTLEMVDSVESQADLLVTGSHGQSDFS